MQDLQEDLKIRSAVMPKASIAAVLPLVFWGVAGYCGRRWTGPLVMPCAGTAGSPTKAGP